MAPNTPQADSKPFPVYKAIWPLLNAPDSLVPNHTPRPNLTKKIKRQLSLNELCSLARVHCPLFAERFPSFRQVSKQVTAQGSLPRPSLGCAGLRSLHTWQVLALHSCPCVMIAFGTIFPTGPQAPEGGGGVLRNHHRTLAQ